jgi:predicted amidophosphoribosyltransferase
MNVMASCPHCSQPFEDSANFCSHCGMAVSRGESSRRDSSGIASPAASLIAAQPRRAGRLALKGFLATFVLRFSFGKFFQVNRHDRCVAE